MNGHYDRDLPEAVSKLARAINRLAKAQGGNLSEGDQHLLAATLSVSEAVTAKLERLALALKTLDARTPNK